MCMIACNFLAIETTSISDTSNEELRSEVMQLNLDYLKIIFSGLCCKVHQNWLIRIVHEMTPLERMSIFVFILGLEFLGGIPNFN